MQSNLPWCNLRSLTHALSFVTRGMRPAPSSLWPPFRQLQGTVRSSLSSLRFKQPQFILLLLVGLVFSSFPHCSLRTLEQLNVPSVGTKHNIQGVVSQVICTKGQLIGNRYFQNSLFGLWSYGIENDGIITTVSHSLPWNFNKKCWIRPLLTTTMYRKTKFPLMFWKTYKLQN